MAPGALALVMMMPPQPSPKSVAIGSTCSSGATSTSCPRARNAAAVRSLSACGRVTTTRMSFYPAHDLIRKPVPTFRDHALIKKSRAGNLFQGAAGVGADGDRIVAAAGHRGFMRGAAVRLGDQATELQPAARQRGVAGDRRIAGAVELGEKRALASDCNRSVGMIDARQQFARAHVARARLNTVGALPGGGNKFFRAHDLGRTRHQPE